MPPVLSGLWKVGTFKLDMNSIHLTVTICYSWRPISISLKPLIHSLVSIPTHLMLLIVLLLTVESAVYHFHFQSTLQTYPTFFIHDSSWLFALLMHYLTAASLTFY